MTDDQQGPDASGQGPAGPSFVTPRRVLGQRAVFRGALADDAAFILGLRTDPVKARHLSATPDDLDAQTAWLERCARDDAQIYFVIEDREGRRHGTVRLYDRRGDSFCWGSWVLADGRPGGFGMESALMVYHFGLWLGFTRAHFDVRRGNASVWKFHERFGAERVAESDQDYFYRIGEAAIRRALARYRRFLPEGVEVIR